MASPAPSSLPPTNASSVAPPPANTSSPTPISPVASPPSPPAEVSPPAVVSPPPASSETSPAPASSSPLPPSSSTTSSPPPSPTSTGKIPSPTTHSSPPPPPHHHSRPSSSSPSPPSSSSSNISTGVVIGVAIGGVVLLVCVSLLCICCKKKKRGRHPPEDYYYGPPPLEPKERPYDRPQQWQHNAPPPADNYVSMPPKPSPPPADNFVPMPPKPSPPPANASRMPLLSVPSQPSASTLSSGGSSNSSVYEIYPPPLPPPPPFGLRAFTYEELEMATEGFSAGNMLGQGGFGYVHKGVLLDGKVVAVKSLKSGSGQGDREFQAEVEIISRVHHKHLVSLVGYCIVGLQRMLVYEYVPNDTLEYHLHGKGRPVMDWPSRLRIALGAAKGLAYLHEDCSPKIIHRDIKASNILLDSNFEAKVADFGLAKFCSDAYTHVSTRVMGTFGYLAPEYAATGKLSDKSDVFSFGIMLLELITGRSPSFSAELSKHDCLIDWARPLLTQALENDDYESLVDERLQSYEKSEMAHMVACASACVRHSARRRPCMSQVVRALEGEMSLLSLNEGLRPTAYRGNHGSHESSDYDTIQYKEYMNKMQKTAIGSQESETSESSGYGLYLSGSSSEYQQSVRTTREMEMGKMKKHGQGGFTGSF